MLIKAKQKEEVTRTEHWDSVEGKALVAAKKRAKVAAGEGGGGGGGEGDEGTGGDPDDEDDGVGLALFTTFFCSQNTFN
jgi:hypothetical protein